MTKQEMRAEMARRVKNLSPVYCREADEAICRVILQAECYQTAQTVFCYVGTEREIDTSRLIHILLQDGKKVAVPLCRAKGFMEARQIMGMGDLVSGQYGILAPRLTCPVVEPEEIDLALVPCSTGNAKGQRLGYGGGYYDRYLPKTNCPKLLLCRRHLVRDDIPMEEHDVKMDFLVTERGIEPCRD
ncbi:MAG: 5-formyltetrahydrofolate cyclo-ligase [Oscillospiraceae bacterium]|nr:5-formyltetrahydrofolate cyclo-ligase [Oscillospiraceae bacterium]